MRFRIIVSMLVVMFLVAGCSDDDSDTGTNPKSAPDIPTGLTITDEGLSSMTLTWDTSDGATGYRLYRSESTPDNFMLRYSGTATDFVDNNVVWVRTYYYRVCAENSTGESDPCTPVSGTTGTPAGFVVTGSPSGSVDYTYNYLDDFNGRPRYQSDPIGLYIVSPSAGDYAGQWVFYDQVEGMDLYYTTSTSDYPPPSGWYAVYGGARTYIALTPF
jgi:hypothetical protein